MNRKMRLLGGLFLVVGLILGMGLAQVVSAAGPWYVSTTGNDTNDCLTEATACLTIQAAIDRASAGDTIHVAAGTYNVDTTIAVNKGVSISGPTSGTASVVGTGTDMFKVFVITSGDVTIENLQITLATTPAYPLLVTDELNSSLISIPSGAGMTGIVIRDNEIYVPAQIPPMSTWTARAITVGSNTVSGMSITGNTIYNTRNGVVVHYNNSATISNNTIYNTKGGIMNYTGSQADADNRIMSNNTWTGAHNEWDIVWNSGGGPYEPDYNQSVLVLSGANNDAYVVSLMTTGIYSELTGNRSHVFVNSATGTNTKHPANGNQNLPYATIALGVEAVVPGGTVYVAAGTYVETGQIVIDKNLTIVGQGCGTTIVKTDRNTGSSGDARGWWLVNAGSILNLSNLTLDGSGFNVYQGVRFNGSGTINGVCFTQIKYPTYMGVAVAAMGDGTVNISDSVFDNIGRIGVIYFGSGVNGSVYDGNTYTGKGDGDWLDYGVEVGGGAQATISDSTISACTGVASSDGSESAGILATTFFGAGTAGTITGNVLTANTTGIHVGYDGSDTSAVVAHNNSIHANTGYAVYSTAPAVDASANWFGTSDPAGVAALVSGNVDYTPWLAVGTDTSTDPGFQGDFSTLWVDDDSPQTGTTGRIQEGIDLVSGSTVYVADGTYTATSLTSILIDKSLSLIGESRDGTIIDAGAWGTSSAGWPRGIQVKANNVTIKNFTVQGFTGDEVSTGGYGIVFRDWDHDYPPETLIYYTGGTVENVKLQNNYSALYALVHSYLTVNNCLIQNNSSDGMFIARWSDHATIMNNTVLNSGNHGIWVGKDWTGYGASDNATITGNTIDGAVEGGITFEASSTATISSNDITNVKGGGWSVGAISLKDGVSNVTVSNNVVHDNSSAGCPADFEPCTGNGIGVDGASTNVIVNNNSIYSNTGYGLKNASAALVNASGNWWGDATPAGVAAKISGNVDYTPWLAVGTDTSTDPGFQGDFSTLWVDDDSPQTGATGRIQEGIDLVSGSTVYVAAGEYAETINVESLTDLNVVGEDKATTIIKPSTTIPWNVGGYGTSRQSPVRVVTSTDIDFSNLTFDFDLVKGNNITGVLYWDGTGTVDNSVLKNMSGADTSGYYYEITSYVRAPSYTDGARAQVSFTGNIFIDTGRLGIVTHDFVHTAISGNTFYKTVDDFGYAMEIGSRSTATISGNTIYGYDTPAASDGSNSAGIYIENSFTGGLPHIVKNVSLSGNEIYNCQWALYIGNEFDGYAGDVDIVLTATGNNFHDNVDGAVVITDEDKAAGSSVTYTGSGNTLTDNGDFGYFIYTYGDGDITVSIDGDTITGHDVGMYLNDYATGTTGSSYSVAIHNGAISDNTTYGVQNEYAGTEIDAELNYWGATTGPYHSTNPNGAGNAVSDNVDFSPWLGLTPGTDPMTYGVLPGTGINDALDLLEPGDALILMAGNHPGGIVINKGNIKIKGLPGAVIGSGSPAFTVTADNVTIEDLVIDGTGDLDAASGIVVGAAVQGLIIQNCEILDWPADGIHIGYDVTNMQILDNYIHDNGSDGLEYASGVTVSGVHEVQGNLFQNNTGYGVNNASSTAYNVEYNSWGDIGGPSAGSGDGASGLLDYTPWTHVALLMASSGSPVADKVAVGATIKYTVKMDASEAYGAAFGLKFDATKLSVQSISNLGTFTQTEACKISTPAEANAAGEISFCGARDTALNGAAQNVFEVVFQGVAAGIVPLDLDETDDSFSMLPPYGASNNIYAVAPTDGSVEVFGVFAVTGRVDLQGRANDTGAVMTFAIGSGQGYGPYTLSTSDYWGSVSASNVVADTYAITVSMPRYLDVTLSSGKTVAIGTLKTALSTLTLFGGDVNSNDEIDITDIAAIGGKFGDTVDPATTQTDINYDGLVDILDLVLAAGNYGKTSVDAYLGWTP